MSKSKRFKPTPTSQAGSLRGLTPLLDTLFLLLFAMLAASHADAPVAPREETVKVRLPEVQGGSDVSTEREVIVLQVNGDGEVLAPGTDRPLGSLDRVDEVLGELLVRRSPEEQPIEIRGDREAPLGAILALLQHLRLRGFSRVQLLARKQDGSPNDPNREGQR